MQLAKILVISILVALNWTAYAKDRNAQTSEPRTKIEEFSAQTGVIIVQGYEKIGVRRGLESSYLRIETKEFINAEKKKSKYGIAIHIYSGPKLDTENISYLDYDEINPLIEAIDYIINIKKNVTKFSDYQADYVTKGGLRISAYSSEGEVRAAVTSGQFLETTAYFPITALPEIRSILIKAKEKIDSVR